MEQTIIVALVGALGTALGVIVKLALDRRKPVNGTVPEEVKGQDPEQIQSGTISFGAWKEYFDENHKKEMQQLFEIRAALTRAGIIK